MPNLVGIGNSQVPTNAMLGGLAYQDSVDVEKISKIKSGKLLTISIECPEALRFQIKTLTDSIITFLYLFVYSRVLLQLSYKEFLLSFLR